MPARRLAPALFGTVLLAGACASEPSSGPTPEAKPTVTFPKSFLWGSATAGFQIESGLVHSDWWHWASDPTRIRGAEHPDRGGPNALLHVADDVAALTNTQQNAYRFSIEWARIYPTRDSFDRDEPDASAVASYTQLFQALANAHVTPIVTLQHFALPDWLSDVTKPSEPQGFERPEVPALFAEWAKRMAIRFGSYVQLWVTINEPLNMALGGYVQGSFPPGRLLAMDRAFAMARGAAEAHARAYDAIHASDPDARVSMAFHLRTFHPRDPEFPPDVEAANRVRYIWNEWLPNIVLYGNVDTDLDGSLKGANDVTGSPSLGGRLDYFGVNYYSDTIIAANAGLVVPVINASVQQDNLPTGRPRTDFGWDIYPEGFGQVLRSLARYKLPVLVLENGLADATDQNRTRFLAEHLYELGRAVADGVPVIGYMHWSLLDNFEWATGFCPKFGFYSVDPATGARTARKSALYYRDVIGRGVMTPAEVDALPPYRAPAARCN
ncbi:MAG: glycoside hydrolase family 1 protein [Polyangiaceae bacterium]